MAQCRRLALCPPVGFLFCLFTYSVISFCIIVFSSHLPRSQSACSHVPVWVRVDANTFLHLYFLICHSRGGCVVVHRNVFSCLLGLLMYNSSSFFILCTFFIASSSCDTTCRPPLPLTHPGYPTGPPTPPPTPDFRHPRIASVYQTSRNLARIYTTARHYSRIRHRSMLLSSRLDPFPYAFFGAHLVYHQFISLLGSGSRFRDVGSSRAWGLDSHVVILRRD